MLTITVPGKEHFDQETQTFSYDEPFVLELEHSLDSLSKWEQEWKIPFLSGKKTDVQTISYVRYMTLTPDVPLDVYVRLSQENADAIDEYIQASLTATTIAERSIEGAVSRRTPPIITAEILYYYMASYNIPFECQYWHLSRLLMLIRVFQAKAAEAEQSSNPKKASTQNDLAARRALNEQRRAANNSRG